MSKVTYKEIGKIIGKSEATIKGYKQNNPELLELLKIGSFCKTNNISLEDIQTLIGFKSQIKNQNTNNNLVISNDILNKVNSLLQIK